MNIYSIILKDGKIIKVNGSAVEWDYKTHHIRVFSGQKVIARYNMDNIAGWTDSMYMSKSAGS